MQGEYRGDFTRNTFDPSKGFTQVLMQQGRVQLDADWNEQGSILLHFLRALAKDIIGDHGGFGDGFLISTSASLDKKAGFSIGKGRYYVDGILCENDEEAMTYTSQRGHPFPNAAELAKNTSYLVFLDVWERHVTAAEDDDIREVALGGADTATRAKLVCQVKVPELTKDEAQTALQKLIDDLRAAQTAGDQDKIAEARQKIRDFTTPENIKLALTTTGRLRARARMTEKSADACSISPESQYRGFENQLYRVEIHRGGTAWDGSRDDKSGEPPANTATFKWSRDNSSVTFPIMRSSGRTVKLTSFGRDERHTLREDDWVEIVNDTLALQDQPGLLFQIATLDRDEMTVTLKEHSGMEPPDYKKGDPSHPFLRRWDHHEGADNLWEGALLLAENKDDEDTAWIALEDGIEIQFPQAAGNTYRAGDYWLIPARAATGDVLWPKHEQSDGSFMATALAPRGIQHHYALLATISLDNDAKVTAVDDLRRVFKQLASA